MPYVNRHVQKDVPYGSVGPVLLDRPNASF
jgi:hypothetical protein